MRKFVKAAAVLALALALLSTSAFAALTGGKVEMNTDGTFTATIEGAAADEQITILATDVENLASVTDADIFYINQKAATGASDSFANFSLKNINLGDTYYFFAGSATSSDVTSLGSVQTQVPYAITLSEDATIEIDQVATIAATITDGYPDDVTWSVDSENATLTETSKLGATLTATATGTYTVTATLSNGASATAVVTVIAKNVTVAAPTVTLVKALASEDASTAENQNGLGVALNFTGLKGFTKMIWVFANGTEGPDARRYSAPIELDEAVSGSAVFMAAFGNGTASGSITPYDVKSVDAIFTDGTYTYFTNEKADKGNELKTNN